MDGLAAIGRVTNCRKIDSHSHNIWEMVYYTEGKVKLTIGEETHTLEPFTFVCQPPGIVHSEMGLPDFCNYYFSVLHYDILPNRPLVIRDTANKSIMLQIGQMYDCYYNKTPNYKNICQAHLNTIIQYALGQQYSEKRVNPYVEKLAYHITEQASDCDFTVEKAYEKLPYSADYLRVIFREEFGCSPGQYLNRTRIRMAKELLDKKFYNRALSVKIIADMCGFRDPLYFSRCFKSATGISPSQYLQTS